MNIGQVYALEKVLALKKDAITQVTFFDEAVKVVFFPNSSSSREISWVNHHA